MRGYKVEIDKMIAHLSRELFSLDELSREILGFIANRGPSTVYLIEKGTGIRRQSIYRRLFGEKEIIGLLNNGFICLEREEKFEKINAVRKKFYGLTFKGFLAALAKAKRLEETHQFKNFSSFIELKGGKSVRQSVEDYVKCEVALWLQFQKRSRINLTYIGTLENLYKHTRIRLFDGWELYLDTSAYMLELLRKKREGEYEKLMKKVKELSAFLDEQLLLERHFSDEIIGLRAELQKQTFLLRKSLKSMQNEKIAEILYYMVGNWPDFLGIDVEEFSKVKDEELEERVFRGPLEWYEPEKITRFFEYPYRIDLKLRDDVLIDLGVRLPAVDRTVLCPQCGSIFLINIPVFPTHHPYTQQCNFKKYCLKCGYEETFKLEKEG
jgi:hypothetical protein